MYNRNLAVDYARRWAYEYNPVYYDFSRIGGDCTNFVSQCIFAGGVSMNFAPNGWFYTSLNKRAPAWTGVKEFWDFGVSNTGVGLKLTPCTLNELEVGDVIQLFNGTRFYHNLLVTYADGRIKVSAHDRNAFNIPLVAYKYTSLRCAKVSR